MARPIDRDVGLPARAGKDARGEPSAAVARVIDLRHFATSSGVSGFSVTAGLGVSVRR
jgi:hypothetical protein